MPHTFVARIASLLRQWLRDFDKRARLRTHDQPMDAWRHRPALRPAYVRIRREADRV